MFGRVLGALAAVCLASSSGADDNDDGTLLAACPSMEILSLRERMDALALAVASRASTWAGDSS